PAGGCEDETLGFKPPVGPVSSVQIVLRPPPTDWRMRMKRLAYTFLAAMGYLACAEAGDDTEQGDSHLESAPPASDDNRAAIVEKKATCPFVGTAVALKKLLVLGSDRPLAPIEGKGSVAELGDLGGGDLGTKVLTFFARGNHHFMLRTGADYSDPAAKLDTTVPANTFSLDFPGSQGSHPGHSGILEDDAKGAPTKLESGGFSRAAFDRLTA